MGASRGRRRDGLEQGRSGWRDIRSSARRYPIGTGETATPSEIATDGISMYAEAIVENEAMNIPEKLEKLKSAFGVD